MLAVLTAVASPLALSAAASLRDRSPASSETVLRPVQRAVDAPALQANRKLSPTFVENAGQADHRVRYLSQGPGYGFYFAEDKVALAFAGERHDDSFLAPLPDARLDKPAEADNAVRHL